MMKSISLFSLLSLLLLQIVATHPAESRTSSITPAFVDRSSELQMAPSSDDDGANILCQAAQVGVVAAAMGHIYGQILDRTVKAVWHDIPNAILQRCKLGPSYIAFACSTGGLLVGLLSSKLKSTFVVAQYVSSLSRSDGGGASLLPELMPYLPNLLILSLVTSTFGFSVGPEAPMVCAGGLIGVAMARNWHTTTTTKGNEEGDDRKQRAEEIMTYAGSAGALTAFMGIPLAGPIFALELTRASAGLSSAAKYAFEPAVAASAAALILLRGILAPKSRMGGHFNYLPADGLTGRASIVTSLVCGAGGAVLATAFHKLVHVLKDVLWKEQNLTDDNNRPIYNREVFVKGMVGIVVGVLGMFYPATLFWGEGSLQCVIDGHQTPFGNTKHGIPEVLTGAAVVNPGLSFQSSWDAAQVGCAKLFSIALACAGKFPGGIIFPLFFAAAPITHAFVSLFSSYIPEAVIPVAVMSLMASTQASVTRTPLATVLMLTLSASSATELSKMLPAVILASYFGVWSSQILSEESYFDYS